MKAFTICAFATMLVLPRAARSEKSAEKSAEESVGLIAVAPPPGPAPALVDLTGQLRRAVAERMAGVLEPAQLRARMGDGAPVSSLSETNRMYEAARATELGGDPQRAIVGLQAAIKDLETFPESEESFAQWSRAMLRVAKIESLLAGHEEQARATLERLLRADPGINVDPDVHGPDVAQLCKSVRSQLARLEKWRLTVSSSSEPAELRVFVNGREVGNSAKGPVVVTLPRGQYKVSGFQGEFRAPSVQVDLSAKDQEIVLDFTIPNVLRPTQGPGLALSPLDTTHIFGAAGFLRLDTVIATNFIENQGATYLIGTVHDIRSGKTKVAGAMRLYNQMAPTGGMDALAHFLLTGEQKKGLVTPYDPLHPDLPKPPGPERQPERPVEKSTAKGWVAFGTGIGAIALTGVSIWQVASSNSKYDSARKLLLSDGSQPSDRAKYDSLITRGDSARRNAVIAGAGAGVCVATTAVLGYLAYKQTGEIGPFRF
jgi:hypothetical protein